MPIGRDQETNFERLVGLISGSRARERTEDRKLEQSRAESTASMARASELRAKAFSKQVQERQQVPERERFELDVAKARSSAGLGQQRIDVARDRNAILQEAQKRLDNIAQQEIKLAQLEAKRKEQELATGQIDFQTRTLGRTMGVLLQAAKVKTTSIILDGLGQDTKVDEALTQSQALKDQGITLAGNAMDLFSDGGLDSMLRERVGKLYQSLSEATGETDPDAIMEAVLSRAEEGGLRPTAGPAPAPTPPAAPVQSEPPADTPFEQAQQTAIQQASTSVFSGPTRKQRAADLD